MNFKEGDRIRLIEMPDDPHPIEYGATGTIFMVSHFSGETHLSVKWDNGRTLGVILPHDKVEKI